MELGQDQSIPEVPERKPMLGTKVQLMWKLRRVCFAKAGLWLGLPLGWPRNIGQRRGWVPGELGEEAELGEALPAWLPALGVLPMVVSLICQRQLTYFS